MSRKIDRKVQSIFDDDQKNKLKVNTNFIEKITDTEVDLHDALPKHQNFALVTCYEPLHKTLENFYSFAFESFVKTQTGIITRIVDEGKVDFSVHYINDLSKNFVSLSETIKEYHDKFNENEKKYESDMNDLVKEREKDSGDIINTREQYDIEKTKRLTLFNENIQSKITANYNKLMSDLDKKYKIVFKKNYNFIWKEFHEFVTKNNEFLITEFKKTNIGDVHYLICVWGVFKDKGQAIEAGKRLKTYGIEGNVLVCATKQIHIFGSQKNPDTNTEYVKEELQDMITARHKDYVNSIRSEQIRKNISIEKNLRDNGKKDINSELKNFTDEEVKCQSEYYNPHDFLELLIEKENDTKKMQDSVRSIVDEMRKSHQSHKVPEDIYKMLSYPPEELDQVLKDRKRDMERERTKIIIDLADDKIKKPEEQTIQSLGNYDLDLDFLK
jgi:hypothetical protein